MERLLKGWVLAAFAMLMLGFAWTERFEPLAYTTFGATLAGHGSEAVVEQVDRGTSAMREHLRPGDIVLVSDLSLSDRYRLITGYSPPGTGVVVPVERNGVRRIVTLRARASANTRPTTVETIVFLITATLTLLIVAFIALRRPSVASAALVFYGAGSVSTYDGAGMFSWLPDPWFGIAAVSIITAFSMLPVLALLPFITRFPEKPAARRARVRMHCADAIFIAAGAWMILQAIYEPIVFTTWTWFDTWSQFGYAAIILVFAAMAYHDVSGEARQRIGWVIAGFVVTTIAATAYNLLATVSTTDESLARAVAVGMQLLVCALPIALAYAILRHRVLDIGFALNRTVVYAVMTTLVVGVVSFADWLTSRLLSQERLAVAVEALITISFGFALNWLHGRIERLIDRIVFRQRHIAEKRIEYRIGALGFAESSSAIDDALALDAPQILGLASAAAFGRLSPRSPFRRNASSGWADDDAAVMDADSILVRTLRSLERPFFLDDAAIADASFPKGATRPAIAVPIVAQHELIGFALYGNHCDGAPADPEEIALLAKLAAAAGSAYGAVEARQWRERAWALEESLRGVTTVQIPS